MTTNRLWNAAVYKNHNPIPHGTKVEYPVDIKLFAVGPDAPSAGQQQTTGETLASIVPEIFTNMSVQLGSVHHGTVIVNLDCGISDGATQMDIADVSKYNVRITKA